MTSSRIIFSIFRRGAAAMQNEIVPDQSIANETYFDDYRTANRYPRSHVTHDNCSLLNRQKGYAVNNAFTAFKSRFEHPTFRVAAFMTMGTPNATRSHFFEQNRIDGGGASYANANSGLFNRFANVIPPTVLSPLDLMSVGNTAARSTIGLISLYATARSVDPLLSSVHVARAKSFMSLSPALGIVEAEVARATASAMLDTNTGLSALPSKTITLPSDATGAPKYPVDPWAVRVRDAARLIIAGISSRYISVDLDGWDHHSDMGGSVNSPAGLKKHSVMLQLYNDSLEAFMYDMEQSGNADRVLIVSQTEFHRTMRENGNDGADHGMSQHAYVWGKTVASDLYGRILDYRENNANTYNDPGSWQNPAYNRLLKYTMDFREYQLMQCEWLAGRVLTDSERVAIWGPTFTSSMTPTLRASIGIN